MTYSQTVYTYFKLFEEIMTRQLILSCMFLAVGMEVNLCFPKQKVVTCSSYDSYNPISEHIFDSFSDFTFFTIASNFIQKETKR